MMKNKKQNNGVIEITLEFEDWWMSPEFYRQLTGEYPAVSTIEQANRFGKTPRDLEKAK